MQDIQTMFIFFLVGCLLFGSNTYVFVQLRKDENYLTNGNVRWMFYRYYILDSFVVCISSIYLFISFIYIINLPLFVIPVYTVSVGILYFTLAIWNSNKLAVMHLSIAMLQRPAIISPMVSVAFMYRGAFLLVIRLFPTVDTGRAIVLVLLSEAFIVVLLLVGFFAYFARKYVKRKE
jgi:hypothetical protein